MSSERKTGENRNPKGMHTFYKVSAELQPGRSTGEITVLAKYPDNPFSKKNEIIMVLP